MRLLLAILVFLICEFSQGQTIGVIASSQIAPAGGGTEAADFKTATGITGSNASAIDSLVKWLKDSGVWNKLQVIYPFIGGTEKSHSYNLKDTLTYKLTWVGSNWSHSATGALKTNTSGYANTGWNPSLEATMPLAGTMGVYSRTDYNGTRSDIGAVQTISGTDYYFQIYPRLSGKFYGQVAVNNVNQSMSVGSSKGWFFTTRNTDLTQYLQYNLTQNDFIDGTVGIPNLPVYIGSQNVNGSDINGSTRELAFVVISNQYLSKPEGLTLYRIIQKYETLLGRQM